MKNIIRFGKGGSVKAIWDDEFSEFFYGAFGENFAGERRRASVIMTVEEGPFRGYFYADMSYLSQVTGLDEHAVCLWPPRLFEKECKFQEINYLDVHFIWKS